MTEKMQEPCLAAKAAVIFDLDGVLCQNTLISGPGRTPDYKAFNKACVNAEKLPEMVFLARVLRHGLAVFVLTARSEEIRQETEGWLNENGVDFTAVLMRPLGNHQPAPILKEAMLDRLQKDYGVHIPGGRPVVFAVEDSPDITDMFLRRGISTLLFKRGRKNVF